MLICDNISKNFDSKEVLTSFSYSFEKSQAYAITGANGRGKTTLLKILAGLLIPSSGEVRGSASHSWYAFSTLSLMDRLSGAEQIESLRFAFGKGGEVTELLENWKSLEGFSEMLETDLGHCSQGMKALLGLFSSTLLGAEVLFWDEPFANLSSVNQNILVNNWRDLTGAKVLITTHQGELPKQFIEVAL